MFFSDEVFMFCPMHQPTYVLNHLNVQSGVINIYNSRYSHVVCMLYHSDMVFLYDGRFGHILILWMRRSLMEMPIRFSRKPLLLVYVDQPWNFDPV